MLKSIFAKLTRQEREWLLKQLGGRPKKEDHTRSRAIWRDVCSVMEAGGQMKKATTATAVKHRLSVETVRRVIAAELARRDGVSDTIWADVHTAGGRRADRLKHGIETAVRYGLTSEAEPVVIDGDVAKLMAKLSRRRARKE